jgi:hypothetical protein
MPVANLKLTGSIVAVFLDFFTAVIYIHFISLLSLYRYLFKLFRGKILFVLEHAVRNFFAINLLKNWQQVVFSI